MRRVPRPLALPLVLAATAGLAAEASLRPEQMRQAMGLKLGAWKTKSRLVDLQIEPAPGVDPAEAERAAAKFRALVGNEVTHEQCLWDNPRALSLPGVHPPPGCEYSRLEAGNGRFAMTSLCKDTDSDGTFAVSLEGAYTPDRLTHRSEASGSETKFRIRMKLEAESRYTGDCPSIPTIRTPPKKGD